MQWQQERRSINVEDRRGVRLSGRGMALGGGGLGLIVVLVVMLLGGDPSQLLGVLGSSQAGYESTRVAVQSTPEEDARIDFVSAVLGSTEDVWNEQFQAAGQSYRDPELVLFRGAVESACGLSEAAVGPFYCPGDEKVYLDLAFFEELENEFHAPGDFAQAYVIAHEVGHHVQKLLGTSDAVARRQQSGSEAQANDLSVRLELQADFFAGVWANHANQTRHVLEEGDVEEALAAAAAVGDDRLQKRSRGYVVPESFTHGTSAQRVKWFKLGLSTGDIRRGDTFAAREL